MYGVTIDPAFSRLGIDFCLGIVYANIQVNNTPAELWNKIEAKMKQLSSLTMEEVRSLRAVSALRESYQKLDKKPSSFLGSNEALLSRAVKSKGLNSINNIVDINNLVSLETYRSVGSYDLDKLGANICFRLGQKDEMYAGLNRPLVLEKLPILADESGAIGSPTADSKRAIITESTKNIMMMIISFDGEDQLAAQTQRSKELLEVFADAKIYKVSIITSNNQEQCLLKKDESMPMRPRLQNNLA